MRLPERNRKPPRWSLRAMRDLVGFWPSVKNIVSSADLSDPATRYQLGVALAFAGRIPLPPSIFDESVSQAGDAEPNGHDPSAEEQLKAEPIPGDQPRGADQAAEALESAAGEIQSWLRCGREILKADALPDATQREFVADMMMKLAVGAVPLDFGEKLRIRELHQRHVIEAAANAAPLSLEIWDAGDDTGPI